MGYNIKGTTTHERGREASKGYGYEYSNLQDRDLHRRQHKFDNYGRKNKERPVVESTAVATATIGVLATDEAIASDSDDSSNSTNNRNAFAISMLEVAVQLTDLSENIFTDTFGDDSMGLNKGLDEQNPFDFGLGGFFKEALEAAKKNQ